MDARVRRSRDALRAAVLEAAAVTPIAQLTVSQICQSAGVTRDTFYRHAAAPAELLADALEAELEPILADMPATRVLDESERALLTHIQQRAAVYRGAMQPLLAAPIRFALDAALRRGLRLWLQLHPDIVPDAIAADPAALRIAIAYSAAGTVGAIEEWLPDGGDPDRAAEMILAASPQWWRATSAIEERKQS
ncbi:hypothetical protein JF531_12745 [Microbacterium esteraromaticum]|uniref:TetR/AcrR family transcriptional regulator n=1 Tax=Microbacterium esteraromaticum TaxID=57043 RepID=UPI0015C6D973|nr:hypothetical protein [Microbacterium esteraromaticum]MBN7794520.1 hypothetical protein [Microbacterium esteraromaticum]MBN8425391.1 hypothetical protein [Microbacterium esteraromaticum]